MQRLEVSGVVRLIYRSLDVKGLNVVIKLRVAVLCYFAVCIRLIYLLSLTVLVPAWSVV